MPTSRPDARKASKKRIRVSAARSSDLPRRRAGVLFQHASQMALVRKSRSDRDLGNGSIGMSQVVIRGFGAERANHFADAAAVTLPIRARQIDRVDIGFARKIG